MLTIEQCRGSRGLLGWTQQDLADASGLSKTAINNFEKGHSDIKSESLRAIRMAFESAEIEFLDQNGIRKKSEDTRILKGPGSMIRLIDDIHDTMMASDDEILISNVDNTIPSQITTEKLFEHIELLKKNNIRERVLCTHGTKNVLSPDDECRWLPQSYMNNNTCMFIYGSKIAIQLWEQSMILIIDSAEANRAEKKRFEQLWAQAEIPADTSEDHPEQQRA